jgi:hypothetical protein
MGAKMKKIEERYVDKSKWSDGEWQDEPDKMQWQDEETGLPCLIVRNGGGALCGYVGVSRDHPLYEKTYDDVYSEGYNIDVHGSLTFSNKCSPTGKICHVVEEGEDDAVWWLGFDCSHGGDISPGFSVFLSGGYEYEVDSYKTIEYVQNEVKDLARQLRDYKS